MAIPSGYPDATTTGVPSGVTLTAYTGPTTITVAGTVIDSKTITNTLNIRAPNVTIKRCRATINGFWGIDASYPEAIGTFTIEDCDIIGPGMSGASDSGVVGSGNFLRNDISQWQNGLRLQEGKSVVRGNYIHDLNDPSADPHYDGIGIQGDQDDVLVEDNSIIARDTSDVFIKPDFGPINNVRVNHNFLGGNVAWNVYFLNCTNCSLTNNIIVKYGFGHYTIENSNVVVSGNTLLLPGDPFPGGNPVADTITLTAVTIANPAMGTASIVAGKLRYTVAAGYSGPVNGTYTITDGAGQTSTAAWSGTVSAPPNPPPLAVADNNAFTVPFGTLSVDVNVLANDFADAP
jgi:hypothetical protein